MEPISHCSILVCKMSNVSFAGSCRVHSSEGEGAIAWAEIPISKAHKLIQMICKLTPCFPRTLSGFSFPIDAASAFYPSPQDKASTEPSARKAHKIAKLCSLVYVNHSGYARGMSNFLLAVAFANIFVAALRAFVNFTNLRFAEKGGVPVEFHGLVDEDKFQQAQSYLAAQTRFGLINNVFSTTCSVAFLLIGGFGWLDREAGGLTASPVYRALVYFLFLGVAGQILELPFSWYHTFVLEQKFGFNRSTVKTFLGDLAKGWGLGIFFGGFLGAMLVWFFVNGGERAWLWAWIFFTAFQLLLTFLAPVLLMPLFNKFEPLAEGELRTAIESFARGVDFKLQGIFTMDGSKRSSKANAFFTGLGRFRRIVLFDTLVKQQSVPELVAVLAHEVGHFKKKHIPQQLLLSLVSSFLMFWLLSLLLKSEALMSAFGFALPSVHAAFTIAFWLYAPFSLFSGLLSHALSRKFEFEADAYARKTTKNPAALVSALKKLSVDSKSNLNPHPWKVMLDYGHPPVIQRVKALLR